MEIKLQCFHPSGQKFVTGNSRGELRIWEIPSTTQSMDDEPITVEKKHSHLVKKMHADSYIGKYKPNTYIKKTNIVYKYRLYSICW